MAKNLNKIMLIGNLADDPIQNGERCNFGLVTNRSWINSKQETQTESVYHPIVAWSKLAELCGTLLKKGMKVYVEGRVNRQERIDYEVVINEMIILDKSE